MFFSRYFRLEVLKKRCIKAYNAQKMEFSIKDFFGNVTKSAVSCGFGHIY